MQSEMKDVYKDLDKVYQDLGDFIFIKAKEHIEKPTALITRIENFGTFFLRKSKMEQRVKGFTEWYERNPPSDERPDLKEKYLENLEDIKIMEERLKDYEKYIEKRKYYRKLKDDFTENQALLKPTEEKGLLDLG